MLRFYWLSKGYEANSWCIYDFNNDDMYVGDTHNKKSEMNDQIIKVSQCN